MNGCASCLLILSFSSFCVLLPAALAHSYLISGELDQIFAPKKIITSAEKVIILAKIITPKLSDPRKK
jgi:hypothetical protein